MIHIKSFKTMDCHSDRVRVESGLMSLSLGRPSSWMLSWFWKGMEKVVPQPVCSSNGGQNLTAGEGGPDQVQGQDDPRVRGESAGDCGAGEAAPGTPCNVCLSVCLSRVEHRSQSPVALRTQVRGKGRMAFWRWELLRGYYWDGPSSGENFHGPWVWLIHCLGGLDLSGLRVARG